MVVERINDRLLLVGTAHVSPESVREVETSIAEFQPDVVAVELDPLRLEALEDKQKWENTPVHKLLKSDKLWLFLTQVMLASYQRKLGEVYGAEPGTEMLAAVRAARVRGAQVALVDRDVGITMRRAVRKMRFREKVRLSWELLKAMVGGTQQEEAPPTTQALTQEDAVTSMMNELGQLAPSVKTVVVDERDAYLATRIQGVLADGGFASRVREQRNGRPSKVVAVVGAGHLPGIRKRIADQAPPADLAELNVVPPKRFSITKWAFAWGLPLFIVALFAYFAYLGAQQGNWDKLTEAFLAWTLITGTFAAIGALLARGHPFSILTAFVAAPITTLHPALAAGWFAGIVEAGVRTPTVADFQALPRITTVKGFFGNRVIRVLMVAALANLGAMAGFFLASYRVLRIFQGG